MCIFTITSWDTHHLFPFKTIHQPKKNSSLAAFRFALMGARSSRDTSDDLLSQSPKSKAFTRRFRHGTRAPVGWVHSLGINAASCWMVRYDTWENSVNCYGFLCGQVPGVSLGWFWWEAGQLTNSLHMSSYIHINGAWFWTDLLPSPFLVSNIKIQMAMSPAYPCLLLLLFLIICRSSNH